ncbi:hypothetical protein LRX75_23090 [Rhizobium sp. DKSPLA3]|uniref:Uncharacterized protein n=1 Tax=Rhizobium quercicola TaxID=2901226 RepID=A0A9X1NV99_9HYPH|nr:hypothetical protein [Rhizobium quercicola]MCD7111915.1 hypothetical protein [Rhizobium quercicola]
MNKFSPEVRERAILIVLDHEARVPVAIGYQILEQVQGLRSFGVSYRFFVVAVEFVVALRLSDLRPLPFPVGKCWQNDGGIEAGPHICRLVLSHFVKVQPPHTVRVKDPGGNERGLPACSIAAIRNGLEMLLMMQYA